LVSTMDGLKVVSPMMRSQALPMGTTPISDGSITGGVKQEGGGSIHNRSWSSSTESSEPNHPQVPSNLGSSYGPDGFPNFAQESPDALSSIINPGELQMTEQARAAIAKAVLRLSIRHSLHRVFSRSRLLSPSHEASPISLNPRPEATIG
jgi:hypothetical protein